jgi:ABC-2 type transport system ATP-binding protein
MIEIKNLSKQYGDYEAVKPINLNIQAGEVFGFLGPNGAGKTTTIRMLMGILVPSGGEAFIKGVSCQSAEVEVKRHIGYLPDNPVFYEYLKAHEILRFIGQMHGLTKSAANDRANELLIQFGLEPVSDEFAVNFSMGMKKKLGLAAAMVHRPAVLILDEPINGLDPRAAREVQDLLTTAAKNGTTIFVSTHLLDMAERFCTRVGFINDGQLIDTGTLEQMRERFAPGGSLEDVFLKVTDATNAHD